MTDVILVFIKNKYIRDAEAYLGAKLPKKSDSDNNDTNAANMEIYMSSELEKNWIETQPHGLIAVYTNISVKQAKDKILKTYENADLDIFIFAEAIMPESSVNTFFI